MAAPKACSPYAKRRFIRSHEEESQVLTGYIKSIAELRRNVNPGDNYIPEMSRRATDRVRAMLAIPMENVINWLADEGALSIKKLKSGEEVLMTVDGNPQDIGEWNAAMKVYFDGQAGGIRQLADNFVMASQAGEGALVQGVELAKQLAWMGNLGEVILGYDQGLGRGLLAQKYAKKGFSPDELVEKINKQRQTRMDVAASENAADYSDKIGDIIARLNDPARAKGAMDDLYELAEQVKFMNSPMNIVKGTTGLKLAGGVWSEYLINSLLSNPATWAANAAGALWTPIRAGSQLFGAGMMRVAAAGGIGDQQLARGVWEMSVAQLMAMKSSMMDAAIMGWQALETGRSVYWDDASIGNTRSISGANLNVGLDKLGMGPAPDGLKETFDWVGRFIRIPSRILTGTDEFAKILAQRGEVAQRAVKRALDDGIDLSDKDLMASYLEAEAKAAFELGPETRFGTAGYGRLRETYDSASTMQEGFGGRSISRVGDEATFQERTGTAATAAAGKINQLLDNPVGQVLRPFMPFVRTPMNIIGQGIGQTTPLGPLTTLARSAGRNKLSPTGIILDMQQQMLKSPTETARISGQIALMTATGATLVGLATTGRMTGGGPSRYAQDKGAQARLRQQVWEENNTKYSIDIGGGNVLPIDRFPEPAATLMRIAADLGAASAYMNQEERDEAFGTYVAVSVTGLYNSSALTGMDRLFRMLRDPSSFDQELAKNIQYWVATQTPMGGAMSYLNKQVDPYERAYETTNTKFLLNFEDIFGKGILGKVAERFPGGSSARPVAVDQLYGKPVPLTPGVGPGGLNPVGDAIPFLPRKGVENAAWQAVWDITGSWSDYKPSSVELTLAEQQQLNALMGTLEINGRTLHQSILQLRNQPEVDLMIRARGLAAPETGTGAAQELNKLRTQYGKAAYARLWRSSVSLQQRAALTKEEKTLKRSNNLEAASTVSQQLNNLLKLAEMEQ